MSIHITFVLFSQSSLLSMVLTSLRGRSTARAAALQRAVIFYVDWLVYILWVIFSNFTTTGARLMIPNRFYLQHVLRVSHQQCVSWDAWLRVCLFMWFIWINKMMTGFLLLVLWQYFEIYLIVWVCLHVYWIDKNFLNFFQLFRKFLN